MPRGTGDIVFIVNRAMAYFEDDAPDSYNLTGLLERDLE